MPPSVLSQTLKSISLTKIREIAKQRHKYEERKQAVLADAAALADDPHRRIARLLDGVGELYPDALADHKVKNVKYWTQQSRYDASVPAAVLESCEELLRGKLEVQSRRLALAQLYSRLVSEWMEPGEQMGGSREGSSSPASAGDASGAASAGDTKDPADAARQKKRLQELCDRFEEVVFTPLETDEVEIDRYLYSMFEGDEAQKALDDLRRRIGASGEQVLKDGAPFDDTTLRWSIKALLAEDLLSEAKQAMLRDFLDNELVLSEIADVLNMRYADLVRWEWDAGPDGIPVLPRQQLNGKYRIWMDEDVLQAIFVEYVGVRCCNFVHARLKTFVVDPRNSVWRWGGSPEKTAELRRRFYLGSAYSESAGYSLNWARRDAYNDAFFLSQLPATPQALGAGSYDSEEAADNPNGDDGSQIWSNIKQQMLRTLAAEIQLHLALRHEAAAVQSDLQWYAAGLPHATVFAVMRFFGFPEPLIAFYRKVLRAPLNMAPSDGSSRGPRVRCRGVPMAHATEKFVGELILFSMDLVVNRETGMLLYRLHDDFFLVGEPERCARAWQSMNGFASVMGLEFNLRKTGSAYLTDGERQKDPEIADMLPPGAVQIGHLALDAASGRWLIDQTHVAEHVAQLKRQLEACGSILGWVQTWNSCIGRFFSHTFGEPAFCLGKEHIDDVLGTYRHMNRVLFGDGSSDSVVQYLRNKIRDRFSVGGVPDAFVLLPEEMGGLGLRNPFIPLLTLRERFVDGSARPDQILRTAFDEERELYKAARKRFAELGSLDDRLRQMRGRLTDREEYEKTRRTVTETLSAEELETFFSFDEYLGTAERTSTPFARAYASLTKTPQADEPTVDSDVKTALNSVGIFAGDDSPKGKQARWVLQMFADELRERLGGLRLVEKKLLPLGVLAMMRQKAVRWDMVL